MRPKTLVLLVAAAFLVVLLAQGPTSGTAAKHVGAAEPIEAASSPVITTAHRPGSRRRAEHFALTEQDGAGRSAQYAQAGSGDGPSATAEPSETSGEYDDEEAVWGDGVQDRSVYASEPTTQFWQWRRIFADEAPDRTWAEQLRRQVTQMGDQLRSAASLHLIDCRETICQLYLHSDDALDAEAMFATMSGARIEVEHQEIAAHVQVESTPKEGPTYEVVVRRARPAWMAPHVPGAGHAQAAESNASEATE